MRRLVRCLLLLLVFGSESFGQPDEASFREGYNSKFTTVASLSSVQRDFTLFPRSIGELITFQKEKGSGGLEELNVALTRGVWRVNQWGYPPQSAPKGAQVRAWFSQDTPDVDASWTHLTNALAGQFCASLNFMDSTQTVSPKYSFSRYGVSPNTDLEASSNVSYFRLGALPGENVCTENLTPWKKLLPCESKRGLSTLLNAGQIHRSKYHSLALSVRQICPQNTRCNVPKVELVQTLTLVFDPSLLHEKSDDPSWSIRSLFGIGLMSACPMARDSKIFIRRAEDRYSFNPAGHELQESQIMQYDLKELIDRGTQNIIATADQNRPLSVLIPPALYATRYTVGFGQEKGGIVTKITNTRSEDVRVVFLDVIPWFLRLYFHTVDVRTVSGKVIKPLLTHFEPGVDRRSSYLLEMVIDIPAREVVHISMNFEKSLLKWLEYPPDANHGFYVGSALITAELSTNQNCTSTVSRTLSTYSQQFSIQEEVIKENNLLVQIYTEALLVNLPTPDFSMPYNVICLACTVIALAFGPLHNITTKSLGIENGDKKGLVSKLTSKIKGIFGRNGSSQ